MQKTRVLGLCLAAGGLALLTGCVAVPGDPYYSGGYSDPYYSDPVVVQPAPVYINGGAYYDRRPYYRDRPYYGRPGYPYPPRPGWNGGGGGRPGWGGGRPPVVAPPVGLPPQRTVPVTPGTGRGVPGALPGMPGYVPQNIAPGSPHQQ